MSNEDLNKIMEILNKEKEKQMESIERVSREKNKTINPIKRYNLQQDWYMFTDFLLGIDTAMIAISKEFSK